MCGITGFFATDGRATADVAPRMADSLHHRGPDDSGVWVDESGLAFGHTRLAILDVSCAGHQPMESRSGRFMLAFNGEIYNHLELRAELGRNGAPGPDAAGRGWRGGSDTETLLALFEARGVEAALKSLVGMFALALYDRKSRVLTLARDRMGQKPLYYGWQREVLLFGSELKSLKAHPGGERRSRRPAGGEAARGRRVDQWRLFRRLT